MQSMPRDFDANPDATGANPAIWAFLEGKVPSRSMQTKAKSFQTRGDDCKIRPTDLGRLDLVKDLLSLLNDPYVGPYKLAETITNFPVFAARCRREAALSRPRSEVEDIERALNVIGNRGIEKVLLELLEDMTILKADLDAAKSK
jgi:hypothetical protein